MTPRLRPSLRCAMLTQVLVAIIVAAWAPGSAADIYKRVDSRGVAHYTDDPKGSGWKRILKTRPAASKAKARAPRRSTRNRKQYGPLVERISAKHNIDAALVHAVVITESAYDPKAVSPKGAAGLMQLMPATAQRYGVNDRFDPEQNIDGGVRYLIDLIRMFDDVQLALAAYNAGEGAVERYKRTIPPFPETQDYVKRVLARYRELTSNRRKS